MTEKTEHGTGNNWATPSELFTQINNIYQLNVDVCATALDAKLPNFITPEEDALSVCWHNRGGRCWMNPPYGRGHLEPWTEKARYEATKGCLVASLLPVCTSTKWWQRNVQPYADYIYFFPQRIKFAGAEGSPRFDNALVVWGLRP